MCNLNWSLIIWDGLRGIPALGKLQPALNEIIKLYGSYSRMINEKKKKHSRPINWLLRHQEKQYLHNGPQSCCVMRQQLGFADLKHKRPARSNFSKNHTQAALQIVADLTPITATAADQQKSCNSKKYKTLLWDVHESINLSASRERTDKKVVKEVRHDNSAQLRCMKSGTKNSYQCFFESFIGL